MLISIKRLETVGFLNIPNQCDVFTNYNELILAVKWKQLVSIRHHHLDY